MGGQRTLAPVPPASFERRHDVADPAGEKFRDRLQPQHEAGIDHVLAGGSEMDMFRRLFADRPAQLPHELGNDDTVDGSCPAHGADVRREATACLGNAIGGRFGDDAVARLGTRKRRLEGQHGANIGDDGEFRRHRLVSEKAGKIGVIEGRIGHAASPALAPFGSKGASHACGNAGAGCRTIKYPGRPFPSRPGDECRRHN